MSYAEKRKGALTGVWIGERIIKGERHRIRANTKAAADKWEALVAATGSVPLDGTGASIKHSLGAVAKEARSRREGWKGSCDTALDQRLEVVLEFFGPLSAVETISKERLYDFVEMLEQRKGRAGGPLSGKTINRYLAVVSALLDFARSCGWTQHLVCIPWQEEAEGRIEFLQKDEEEAVVALLSEDEALCMRLLTLTGMRAGEFFNLRVSDIDVSDNRCAWIRLRGMDVKSGKGRSIPLHDADLARWLRKAVEQGTLPGHHTFYKSFKRACVALGLSEGLCVHSLRHTFGTRAAKATKPAMVQALMGHGSYKTTQRYIHLTDDDLMTATAGL